MAVSRDGGQPVAIGRVSQEFTSAGGAAWLPDGHIAFSTGGTSLMEMPVGGGEAQPLFQLDPAKEADIHQPSALPDGRGVLYVLHPVKGSWSIELYLPLSRSRQTILTATSDGGSFFRPTYAPTGHILFQQGSGIWALPFSLSSLQRTGDAFLVADHAREPAISRDGTLVMLPGGGLGADSQLTWIDRTGKSLRALGQTRGAVFHPRVSPDGRLVAATIGPMEQSDLWVFNNENGTERRLTFEAGIDAFPSWSPDGQFIVYQCGASACARRADGAGARVQLVDGPAEAPKLSPDGRLLVFVRESAPGNDDVFVVEIAPTGLTAPYSNPRRAS